MYLIVDELAASFALDRTAAASAKLWSIRDPQQVSGDIKVAAILLWEEHSR